MIPQAEVTFSMGEGGSVAEERQRRLGRDVCTDSAQAIRGQRDR